jgi:hypothetical protein
VSYSEIVLAPGSGRLVQLRLLDADGQTIDFTVGSWQAKMVILPYPMYVGTPIATLTTTGVTVSDGPKYEWLTLGANSYLTLTPSSIVTKDWRWTRQHYDCYVTGPNVNSEPDRVAHGPIRMDW